MFPRGVPTLALLVLALAASGALFYEVEAIPLAHPAEEQGFFATIWTSIFSASESNEKDDDDYGDLNNSTTTVPEETEAGVEIGVVPLNTTTTFATETVEENTRAARVKRATHKIPESVVIPGNGSVNYFRY
uniref:Putative conserved secreted protein n=1 Tax=Culex tarsalis TaxID=7177 RepID=A0A1Q3G575_CULTA